MEGGYVMNPITEVAHKLAKHTILIYILCLIKYAEEIYIYICKILWNLKDSYMLYFAVVKTQVTFSKR